PPVELGIAQLDLAAAPVDEIGRVIVEPGDSESERLALTAEVGPVPVELTRQDHEGALLLDAHLAAQVAFCGLLELLVEHAAAEGMQGRRRAAGAIQP